MEPHDLFISQPTLGPDSGTSYFEPTAEVLAEDLTLACDK
jgi:hypothetical protein